MVGKFIPVYEGEDQERPSKGCDHKKIANGCPDARRTKGAGHYVEFWGLKCLGNVLFRVVMIFFRQFLLGIQ